MRSRTWRVGCTILLFGCLAFLAEAGQAAVPEATLTTATNAPSVAVTNATSSAPNTSTVVSPEPPPPPATAEPPSKDLAWVDDQLQRLSQNTSLDESTRRTLELLYQDCRSSLTSLEVFAAERDRFAALRSKIPERLAELHVDNQEAPSSETPAGETIAVNQVEKTLARMESALANSQSRLRRLEATPQERIDRLIEIARQLTADRLQHQELRQPPKAESSAPAAAELNAAREAARVLKMQALDLEIGALTEEQLYYEAGRELLSAELENAGRDVERATTRVKLWRQYLTERRQESVDEDLARWSDEADRALTLADHHPLVIALIQTNQVLVARRADPEGIVHKIDVVTEQLANLKEQLRMPAGLVPACPEPAAID